MTKTCLEIPVSFCGDGSNMNRLPAVLQKEIWEYVRGDSKYWKQQFSKVVAGIFPEEFFCNSWAWDYDQHGNLVEILTIVPPNRAQSYVVIISDLLKDGGEFPMRIFPQTTKIPVAQKLFNRLTEISPTDELFDFLEENHQQLFRR